MPHISFKYSIKKDADNWIDRFYNQDEISFIPLNDIREKYPPALLVKIEGISGRKEAHKIVSEYLKNDLEINKKMPIIKQELKAIRSAWKTREGDFFATIENLLEKSIYSEEFDAFFTTFFRCPHSEKDGWFMINFWSSLPEQITTIAHEILHLQFLNQYRPTLEASGLNEKQIQDLKEALTFLLNEKEFFGILIKPDKGYQEHEILRKKLKDIWDNSRIFHRFLPEAIKLLKE